MKKIGREKDLIKIFEHDRYDGMLCGLCLYKGKIQYAWLINWGAEKWVYDIYELSTLQRFQLLLDKWLFGNMVGHYCSYKDNKRLVGTNKPLTRFYHKGLRDCLKLPSGTH